MESDVGGIENLANIDGNMRISRNGNLVNSSGLSKQACLKVLLKINLNHVFYGIIRPSRMDEMNKDMKIQGHSTLASINDIRSLARVGGPLLARPNAKLVRLENSSFFLKG